MPARCLLSGGPDDGGRWRCRELLELAADRAVGRAQILGDRKDDLVGREIEDPDARLALAVVTRCEGVLAASLACEGKASEDHVVEGAAEKRVDPAVDVDDDLSFVES